MPAPAAIALGRIAGWAIERQVGISTKKTWGAAVWATRGTQRFGIGIGGQLRGWNTSAVFRIGRINRNMRNPSWSYLVDVRFLSGGYASAEDISSNALKFRNVARFGLRDNGGLQKLGKGLGNGIATAGNGVKMDMDIDLSSFNNAMSQYVKFTRRSAKEIVNQKSFSIATQAYQLTYNIPKETLKSELSSTSNIAPTLRKADILAIKILKSRGKSYKRKDVKKMGDKFIRLKSSHVKSLNRTWLPAMSAFATTIGKSGKRSGKPYGNGYGHPETRETDMAQAVLASVTKLTKNNVNNYLNAGLQKAFNAEAASMQQYVQKKIDKQNAQFNTLIFK